MDSIEQVFNKLNDSGVNYVVLRNFEDLMKDDFISNHPDIDFLCDDYTKLTEVVGAYSKPNIKDNVHYLLNIGDNVIPIDVRCVGDDYYDRNWETKILKTRKLFKGFCYVPNIEEYYYSLLYHTLIQKEKISSDYMELFQKLETQLGINVKDSRLQQLEHYMINNGYKYVCPEDIGVGFHVKNSNRKLIKFDSHRKLQRRIIQLKRLIKRLIHLE